MADEPLADSSSASTSSAPVVPATSSSDRLADLSPEALTTWRMTGKFPDSSAEPSSPEADSTPADTPAETPAVDTSVDVQPAKSSPAKKTKTDYRFDDLLADRQKERERADRLERELAALRAQPRPPTDARPAAPSAAPGSDPEPNPDDAEKYPDGIYDRRFMKDSANWEARQVLRAEQQAHWQRQREFHVRRRQTEELMAWGQRVDACKAKYPDWEQKIATVDIQAGSPIDVWVMESEHGPDLLYGPLSDPAVVKRISRLSGVQQVRELAKLEASLEPAPAKTMTDAPNPPRTLGSRTTTSHGDEPDRALAAKDEAGYIAAANARDLARWKASHR